MIERLSERLTSLREGHQSIGSTLLEYGSNSNHRYEGGFTPLMEAAASGNVEVTKLLLALGADRMIRSNGKTAVDLAFEKEQKDTLSFSNNWGEKPSVR